MYVGMAWVRPWLIPLEGEYIRLTLIWWYGCYYIRDDFMYVGVVVLGAVSYLADATGLRLDLAAVHEKDERSDKTLSMRSTNADNILHNSV